MKPLPDLEGYTAEQYDQIEQSVREHRDRLYVEEFMPSQIEEMIAGYQTAMGLADGTAWRQPTGAHDAVPPGESRVFEGHLWENTSGTYLSHSPAEFPQGWTDRGEAGEGPPPP